MDKVAKTWRLVGALVLIPLSYLIFMADVMNPFVPMPVHLVILAWIISLGAVIVMPTIYYLQFTATFRLKNPNLVILVMALVFTVLNVLYFWNSWSYGMKWQGLFHTKVVALENLTGFSLMIALALAGIRKDQHQYLYAANLLLFVLLTWCAFPYLGEMP